MKTLHIWWLKWRLRSALRYYQEQLDCLGCGLEMAGQLPSVEAARHKFLARLAALNQAFVRYGP